MNQLIVYCNLEFIKHSESRFQ